MLSPYILIGNLIAVATLAVGSVIFRRCYKKRRLQKMSNRAKSKELARRL